MRREARKIMDIWAILNWKFRESVTVTFAMNDRKLHDTSWQKWSNTLNWLSAWQTPKLLRSSPVDKHLSTGLQRRHTAEINSAQNHWCLYPKPVWIQLQRITEDVCQYTAPALKILLTDKITLDAMSQHNAAKLDSVKRKGWFFF